MALIGKRNLLAVVREAPPGLYLDGGTHGEILLPGRYIDRSKPLPASIDVFVYRDSEDRLVATPQAPYAMVGEFAFLRVVGMNPKAGVFLEWGLEKDLLLPIREQGGPLRVDDWLVVHVSLDERTDRIVASSRLARRFSTTPPTYADDQPVRLLVYAESPLGYKAIVNHAHSGLLYRSELGESLAIGQSLDGFVRTVRADGKIDLALQPSGYRRIAPLTEQVLEALSVSGGRMPYHDKSTPDEIRSAFGVSKKAFKQAIGALYRDRKIELLPDAIRLAASKTSPHPSPRP